MQPLSVHFTKVEDYICTCMTESESASASVWSSKDKTE